MLLPGNRRCLGLVDVFVATVVTLQFWSLRVHEPPCFNTEVAVVGRNCRAPQRPYEHSWPLNPQATLNRSDQQLNFMATSVRAHFEKWIYFVCRKLTWQNLLCQAFATLCFLISFVVDYPCSCALQQQCRFASSHHALTSSYIKSLSFNFSWVGRFPVDRMCPYLDGKAIQLEYRCRL